MSGGTMCRMIHSKLLCLPTLRIYYRFRMPSGTLMLMMFQSEANPARYVLGLDLPLRLGSVLIKGGNIKGEVLVWVEAGDDEP